MNGARTQPAGNLGPHPRVSYRRQCLAPLRARNDPARRSRRHLANRQRHPRAPRQGTRARREPARVRARRDRDRHAVPFRNGPAGPFRHRLCGSACGQRWSGCAGSHVVDHRCRRASRCNCRHARSRYHRAAFGCAARTVRARDRSGTRVPDAPAARRASSGRTGRHHDRRNSRLGGTPGRDRAPRADVREEHRRRRARRAARRRSGSRAVPARGPVADCADARPDRR